MKKKKMITENPNISRSDKKNGRLIRYRERLEKEKLNSEKERNALFRKRVRTASEKKAPGTLRTRAYYRFSSEFPSVVSPDGFRENIPEREKMTGRARAVVSIVCVCVFIFTLIALETGVRLSLREPGRDISGSAAAKEEKIKALNDAGIKCLAYISCFKDTVAASSLSGMEVLTSLGGLFRTALMLCGLIRIHLPLTTILQGL